MKKLVLVAALFMFVCGGSFVANAQDPVKTQQQQPPTVLLQRKHLHSLLNNSKHTATKAVPSLSILGNGFCRF